MPRPALYLLLCVVVTGCDSYLFVDRPRPDAGPPDPCRRKVCPEGEFCVTRPGDTRCLLDTSTPCDRRECTADGQGFTNCFGGFADPRSVATCRDGRVCVDTGESVGCVEAPPVPCTHDRCVSDSRILRCSYLGFAESYRTCGEGRACREWADGAACVADPPLPCDGLPIERCGDERVVRQHCIEELGLLTPPSFPRHCTPIIETCFQGDDAAACALREAIPCETPSREVERFGQTVGDGVVYAPDEPLGCDGRRLLYCGATGLVGVMAECESTCELELLLTGTWARCEGQQTSLP